MKRVVIIAVLASVFGGLAITGLTLGLAGSAHAAPDGPAASPAQGSTTLAVVFDCPGQHALVRPRSFILTCADGNAYFAKLSWTSWTPGLASAKGTLVLNDCTPYCAAGHFHSYPAIVVLWGSKAVQGHPGERCYTKLTEILTGPRPRYYDAVHRKWVTAPQTQTIPLLTSGHAA
jgi:hypothetical protein